MKKILRTIPAIILSVFLMSLFSFVYASAATGDTTQQTIQSREKSITNMRLVFPAKNRFVKLGSKPDFTNARIKVTYSDGSVSYIKYNSKYFVRWTGNTLGRAIVEFDVNGNKFTDYFIVYDETRNVLQFNDVTPQYWGFRQIQRCFSAGFFSGMGDGSFGVAEKMTRAQFCQLIYNIYKNDPSVMTLDKEVTFTDVTKKDWFYKAVILCARAEIVNGMGDGTFHPNDPIKREDVAVIMMRIIYGQDKIEKSNSAKLLKIAREQKGIQANDFHTASQYAKKHLAASLGIIYYGDDKGNLNPKDFITRTECAAIINNMFFKGFVDLPIPQAPVDTAPKPTPTPTPTPTPEPTPTPTPTKKRVVYLSPENIEKPYAIYDPNDPVKKHYNEHEQMTIVANKVKAILEKKGVVVHVAKKEVSIKDENYNRAIEAKNLGADCYVALHTNAAATPNTNGKAQGTICFYNGNNKGAKELSQFIYNNLSALTPTKDGGSLNDINVPKPFQEIKRPTMANVLCEIQFHDYAPYATWIVNNTDKIAAAVADGIYKYLSTLK